MSKTSTFTKVLTMLLAVIMVISLLPVSQASAVTGNTAAADGTYTGSGRIYYRGDERSYDYSLTITVSGGKFTDFTYSAPGASDKSNSLHKKALSDIVSQLSDKAATASNASSIDLDAVSGATYSYNSLRSLIQQLIANAPSSVSSGYTVVWQNDDGTELYTQPNVPSGRTVHYSGTPTKASTAQYDSSAAS